MTDTGKENVIQLEEGGSIRISEDVILTIAALAAESGEDVLLAGGGDAAGKKNFSKAIRLTQAEGESAVIVDICVLVAYGSAIQSVSARLQERVKATMESMTGLTVKQVNVHVNGVTFEKEVKKEAKK